MMTRLIALAVVTLTLAACSTPQATPQPLAGSAGSGSVWVATLSTNACEAAIAPLQTRAIVGTHQARRQLAAGRIDAAQAQTVADAAREAQAGARAACPTKDKPDPEQLARIESAVARMTTVLGDK